MTSWNDDTDATRESDTANLQQMTNDSVGSARVIPSSARSEQTAAAEPTAAADDEKYDDDEPDAAAEVVQPAAQSFLREAPSQPRPSRALVTVKQPPSVVRYDDGDGDDDDAPLPNPSSSDPTGLSSIHSSYLGHIRALQKTNAALAKKNDYLVSLSADNTKMKLIKKLQRVLREKQLMVDDLADTVVSKGAMTVESLALHLQQLIDSSALDQPNPARMKKDLSDARKDNVRLLAELRDAKRALRSGEKGVVGPGAVVSSSRPSAASQAALADRSAAAEALQSELLSLSSAHSALRGAHDALSLSLGKHQELLEGVTGENRSLRGYLTQWQASEERRIMAEQSLALLTAEKNRWTQEREGVYQEARSWRSKLAALARAKANAEVDALEKIRSHATQAKSATDKASALAKQVALLQADLSEALARAEWHRAKSVATLAASGLGAEERKAHTTEVAALKRQLEDAKSRATLSLDTALRREALSHTPSSNAAFALRLLDENARMNRAAEEWESTLGDALARANAVDTRVAEAQSATHRAENELAVLQTAMAAMAADLSQTQRTVAEQAKRLTHLETVKIPRMRTQRSNLAAACHRQNIAIQSMSARLDSGNGFQHDARSNAASKQSTPARTALAASSSTSTLASVNATATPQALGTYASKTTSSHLSTAAPSTSVASTPARVASAAPAASSPPAWHDPSGEWSRFATEDGQAFFYFNNITSDSVWADPLAHATAQSSELDTDLDLGGMSALESAQPTPRVAPTAARASLPAVTSVAPVAAKKATQLLPPAAAQNNSDLELSPLGTARDFAQLSARSAPAPADAIDEYDDFDEETKAPATAAPAVAPASSVAKPAISRLPTAGHESAAVEDDFPEEEEMF